MSIILLKVFIKLNVNMGMTVKDAWSAELNSKILNDALNTQLLKVLNACVTLRFTKNRLTKTFKKFANIYKYQ